LELLINSSLNILHKKEFIIGSESQHTTSSSLSNYSYIDQINLHNYNYKTPLEIQTSNEDADKFCNDEYRPNREKFKIKNSDTGCFMDIDMLPNLSILNNHFDSDGDFFTVNSFR
jgi:hypothetical protein